MLVKELFLNLISFIMKIIILFSMLFFLTTNLYSQRAIPNQLLSSQDYLKKSKNQKTAAWILLGGGALTSIIGLSQINLAGSDDGDINNAPGTILFFTGLAATITSIPLFSSAIKNKKKAINVSTHFELRKNPTKSQSELTIHSIPSLTVKFSF
jgi:hypothetical protein